ncbi:serine/threonine-protein kinase [Streptomyces sp. C10]|uniref:serine/threonine-protein kinase n=1 Tax=Streptomyces sp. C10 TaxID=531941 RepID=UPI00397FA244
MSGPGEPGGEPSRSADGGAGHGEPGAAAASGPRRGKDADLTGRLLGGRYRVTDRIGRGGMGVVCRAVDEVLGREVAVKVLRAYTDASAPELADLRTRMQREARAAARIRHSGVITVHDVIDEDGRPVIVMELVDGPSLDDALEQQGPLDPREIARIGAEVMDALDAAHQAGVLHRDVKPGNVLLDRWGHRPDRSGAGGGRVVLTDFGIASIEAPGDGATTHLTRSGELVGSLDYLPPERAQGQDPTPASDIWSLGMTLYAAVEGGGAPFRRTSVWSTLTAIVTEALPEPRRAGPLTPVLHALMAKNPADRPSAAQARSLLAAVAEGREPTPLPTPGASHSPTVTDVRAVAPSAAPGEHGPTVGAGGPGGAAAGPAGATGPSPIGPGATGPTGPVNAGAQPAGGLSGPGAPGAQGAPATQPTPLSAPAPAPAPTPPSAPAGHPTPPPGTPGPYPASPAERDTGRDTERVPAPGRRRVLPAVAAVLAVLAAGGGLTYALVGGGSSETVADRGRQSAPSAGTPGGPDTRGEAGGKAGGEEGDKDNAKGNDKGNDKGKGGGKSASPSASDRPSEGDGTEDPKPGGAGGSPGGQGGDSGGTQGGTDGGSGSDGGQGGASGGSGGDSGSGGGEPTEGPSCESIGGGKANCDVWRSANSYTGSFQQVGTLNMGTNYFYCQTKLGRRETYGKWTNVWWAKTDDDSGNSGVYISVVYLKGGANDQPVPGLPTC